MRPLRSTRIDFPETRFYVKVKLWRSWQELTKAVGREEGDPVYGFFHSPGMLRQFRGHTFYLGIPAQLGTIHLCRGCLDTKRNIVHEAIHCIQKIEDVYATCGMMPDTYDEWNEQLAGWLEYLICSITNWLEDVNAYRARCSECHKLGGYESWLPNKPLMCPICAIKLKLDPITLLPITNEE